MNYSINKFFDKNKCDELIEFFEKNGVSFSYDPKSVWDCKRIHDKNFKEYILNTISELYSKKLISFWFNYAEFRIKNVNLSLTKYYDGRYLDLHRDATSNYTTVICLNDNFENGDFCLSTNPVDIKDSEVKIHLNLGEGITFEGNKTYHGVMPVTIGTRYALSIWTNDTDFSYDPNQIKNKII